MPVRRVDRSARAIAPSRVYGLQCGADHAVRTRLQLHCRAGDLPQAGHCGMSDDWDRSVDRWIEAEYNLIKAAGFGVSKQGTVLSREYLPQLTRYIAGERRNGRRNRSVWRALKNLDDRQIALQLLTSGIDV